MPRIESERAQLSELTAAHAEMGARLNAAMATGDIVSARVGALEGTLAEKEKLLLELDREVAPAPPP